MGRSRPEPPANSCTRCPESLARLPSSPTSGSSGMRHSGPSMHSEGRPMPAMELEHMHGLFGQAFNAADLEALMALYEPHAALIPQPGTVAQGTPAVRDALRWFLDRRGRGTHPIKASAQPQRIRL